MKQLTCEMCGSTDLLKQDGVFVCQSCGCKYSVEEARKMMIEGTVDVSGSTVFIDNTKQIENDLKRAKQYENEGDSFSAAEYYNKVLDAEAENIEAKEGLTRLKNKSKYLDYYVVEPKISSEESVKRFLQSLSTAENIICDIYGNIKIKSIIEKYYNFSFLKANGYVSWTAIRCDEYTENETVYKTEYQNGRQIKVPETKKVTKVERTPINGSAEWNCQKLFFASNAIVNAIGGKNNTFADELNEKFIELQDDNYGDYNPVRLDSSKLIEKDGLTNYDGIEIELSIDTSLERNISSQLINTEMNNCCEGVLGRSLHTYYENINSTTHTSSETIARILIPIQIITYEYKGKEYVAVSDMISNDQFIQTIPTDTDLHNSRKEIEEATDNINTNAISVGKTFMGIGIVSMVIGVIASFLGFEDGILAGLMITFIISDVLGLILFFAGSSSVKKKRKEIAAKETEMSKLLVEPRVNIMNNSKRNFFANYSDPSSVETASLSASVNDSSVNNIEVLTTIAVSKPEKTTDSHNDFNDKDLFEIKELAYKNKLEAIKKYIELYGVSLAEAKIAVEKLLDQRGVDSEIV